MGVLLAAVQTLSATPVPSPQVVKEILSPVVTQQYITPEGVIKLLHLLEIVGLGALVSFLHFLVDRGKLGRNLNRLIVVVYTALTGAAYMLVTGKTAVTAEDAQIAGTVVATFLGSNQATHMIIDTIRDIAGRFFAPKEPVSLSSDEMVNEPTV